MKVKNSDHIDKDSDVIKVVVACYYPLLREGISR